MQRSTKTIRPHWFFILISIAVILAYYKLYEPYFPNSHGRFGHDYQQQLPNLLAGYYWYLNNGLFSIPWFSPAQCGGLPFYGDPGHGLYALPQLLVLVVNPILSIKLTFFIFAIAGYLGFYFLLRKKFQISTPFAVLGAALFLFNGFYAHRMIIGHPFHAFMLLPYLIILLLPNPSASPGSLQKHIFHTSLAGLIFAYMFHSAMVHLLPPALLSIVIILLIHAFLHEWQRVAWLRLAGAILLAVGLSASKLVASTSFLANFPREHYPLPGFPNLLDALTVVAHSLFFRPPTDQVAAFITNSQLIIEQHELEFGVTPVPLVIILVAIIVYLVLLIRNQTHVTLTKRRIGYAVIIGLLLLVPILLNYYDPAWNMILKSVPILKSSSLLLRWFAAYIPISIVAAMLLLDTTPFAKRYSFWIAAASIVFAIGFHFTENRDHYERQTYDGNITVAAYEQSKATGAPAPIVGIATSGAEVGHRNAVGNDVMTDGLSQLRCYNAIFGYRLEQFPVADLHTGPALEITNDHLNIKNPSCYLFPAENNCKPGEHFKAAQQAEAERFLQYKAFSFKKSGLQKSADVLNVAVLLLLGATLVYALIPRTRVEKATPAPGPKKSRLQRGDGNASQKKARSRRKKPN